MIKQNVKDVVNMIGALVHTLFANKTFTTVFAAVCLLIAGYCIGNAQKNIIKLKEYEHGVVICDDAVVINYGHWNDPEVSKLLQLAERKCSQ